MRYLSAMSAPSSEPPKDPVSARWRLFPTTMGKGLEALGVDAALLAALDPICASSNNSFDKPEAAAALAKLCPDATLRNLFVYRFESVRKCIVLLVKATKEKLPPSLHEKCDKHLLGFEPPSLVAMIDSALAASAPATVPQFKSPKERSTAIAQHYDETITELAVRVAAVVSGKQEAPPPSSAGSAAAGGAAPKPNKGSSSSGGAAAAAAAAAPSSSSSGNTKCSSASPGAADDDLVIVDDSSDAEVSAPAVSKGRKGKAAAASAGASHDGAAQSSKRGGGSSSAAATSAASAAKQSDSNSSSSGGSSKAKKAAAAPTTVEEADVEMISDSDEADHAAASTSAAASSAKSATAPTPVSSPAPAATRASAVDKSKEAEEGAPVASPSSAVAAASGGSDVASVSASEAATGTNAGGGRRRASTAQAPIYNDEARFRAQEQAAGTVTSSGTKGRGRAKAGAGASSADGAGAGAGASVDQANGGGAAKASKAKPKCTACMQELDACVRLGDAEPGLDAEVNKVAKLAAQAELEDPFSDLASSQALRNRRILTLHDLTMFGMCFADKLTSEDESERDSVPVVVQQHEAYVRKMAEHLNEQRETFARTGSPDDRPVMRLHSFALFHSKCRHYIPLDHCLRPHMWNEKERAYRISALGWLGPLVSEEGGSGSGDDAASSSVVASGAPILITGFSDFLPDAVSINIALARN